MAERNRKTETVSRRPQLISVPDAARELGVCSSTVRNLMKSGELPSVKLRRRRFIATADIDALIAKLREAPRDN